MTKNILNVLTDIRKTREEAGRQHEGWIEDVLKLLEDLATHITIIYELIGDKYEEGSRKQ